eukprot:Opistho-1_new@38681
MCVLCFLRRKEMKALLHARRGTALRKHQPGDIGVALARQTFARGVVRSCTRPLGFLRWNMFDTRAREKEAQKKQGDARRRAHAGHGDGVRVPLELFVDKVDHVLGVADAERRPRRLRERRSKVGVVRARPRHGVEVTLGLVARRQRNGRRLLLERVGVDVPVRTRRGRREANQRLVARAHRERRGRANPRRKRLGPNQAGEVERVRARAVRHLRVVEARAERIRGGVALLGNERLLGAVCAGAGHERRVLRHKANLACLDRVRRLAALVAVAVDHGQHGRGARAHGLLADSTAHIQAHAERVRRAVLHRHVHRLLAGAANRRREAIAGGAGARVLRNLNVSLELRHVDVSTHKSDLPNQGGSD